ncbi:uncharacterized protein [Apostichopus japonicus]|uniref:uncharacterized protein isoform X2 n=1 Tax=Stichopus japonicus TaxID=307972 RepID=UPI003AB2F9D9
MDRSVFQTSFILGFVLYLAIGQDTCDGYSHKNDSNFVYGVLGQNITLSCELQAYCIRGLWAFRKSPVKYLTAGSCSNCVESFSVTDIINGDIMYSSLHIININERLAGIYDCSCLHDNGADKVKCFNLQIEHASCQLELTQSEKVKVFHNSYGSQHGEAVRTVNVNTDDNITARCVNNVAKLNTNCQNKSGLLKVKKSQYGCWISCRINKLCRTRIILSVISSTTNSPSTYTTKEEDTRSTKNKSGQKFTANMTGILVGVIVLTLLVLVLILIIIFLFRFVFWKYSKKDEREYSRDIRLFTAATGETTYSKTIYPSTIDYSDIEYARQIYPSILDNSDIEYERHIHNLVPLYDDIK